MQQSAAFKILQTRLGTVPPYSFSGEQQFRRTSSSSHMPNHRASSRQHYQDDDYNEDNHNEDNNNMATSTSSSNHNGINFMLRLQQFEQMQHQHRMNTKSQLQARHSTSSTLSSHQVFFSKHYYFCFYFVYYRILNDYM